MKALIYILCFFGYVVLQVILMNAGITLGGIPTGILFFLTWAAASHLSKAWQNRYNKKENEERS